MSVHRDTPRGPTSEQLRRRALAHEQRIAAPNPAYMPCESYNIGGGRCLLHGGHVGYHRNLVHSWPQRAD